MMRASISLGCVLSLQIQRRHCWIRSTGTALRIDHQLNRFTLDFAVLKPMATDRILELANTAFDALESQP